MGLLEFNEKFRGGLVDIIFEEFEEFGGVIYNSDCLEVLKTLADESIDLIATDPPYKITSRGNSGNTGGMLKNELSMDGKIFQHNDISVKDYAPEYFRVLKDGSHCYVMCNHINLIEMLNVFIENGFHFIKSLIWDKGNKIMGRFYMSQFEYILFFRKGKGVQINNCGTSDILSIPNKKDKVDGANIHDTQKPVELMKILIENSTKEGDIILDSFMGSGTTAIACVKSNRRFIGSEIDEKYYKTTIGRLEKLKSKNKVGLF